jgi:thioredoxin 1
MTHSVNDKNFKEEVLNADTFTLVDFYGEWCSFCRMFSPIFEKLACEYEGKIKFCKSNVDDTIKHAENYNINGVPHLILFKNGNILGSLTGVKPHSEIKLFLDNHLNYESGLKL